MMFEEHMVDRNKRREGCVWLDFFPSEWVYKEYLVLKQHDFVPKIDKKQLTLKQFYPLSCPPTGILLSMLKVSEGQIHVVCGSSFLL